MICLIESNNMDDLFDYDIDNTDDVVSEDTKVLILADFNWKPNNEKLPWKSPNFAKEIVNRIKGVTEESFAVEVELWQEAISSLPDFDELEIRKEIRGWDIGTPDKDNYNIEAYAAAYSMQVSYRTRLVELISIVYAHHELIFQAHKTLREMAMNLADGPKHDKESYASFTVHPFVIPLTHAKRLLAYLESVLKTVDFAATQMDRILREHQALARINQSFNNMGMSQIYEDNKPKIHKYNNSDIEIPNRQRI